VFGEDTEEIFDQLHKARRDIEATASVMVFEDEPFDPKDPSYKDELRGYRTTIYGPMRTGEADPVAEKLEDCPILETDRTRTERSAARAHGCGFGRPRCAAAPSTAPVEESSVSPDRCCPTIIGAHTLCV
jgi:hypothetical protein